MRLKFSSILFIPLTLAAITFITYFNILPNKLFFDDEELIYKNAYVSNLKYFPKYFITNMIAGAGKTSNMYRPVLTTSFAVDHLFWGNNPFGYHLTSILLHAANGILVFFLIYKLFKDKLLAFLTAAFFIIHPIQSEAVIYASGRTDPLVTFFSLMSIILFLSYIASNKFKIKKYICSIFFFILALLSKETAAILPFLFLLTYSIYVKIKKSDFLKPLFLVLPFFILDIVYICLRLTVLNFSDTLNLYTTANLYSGNLSVRLFTFFYAFFQYLGMLAFPKDLIIARTAGVITSVTNHWVILFLVVWFLLLIFSIKSWKKNKLFFFTLVWFLVSIIPVSGIIPINNIIAEHYLYLPSIAFFLIVAYLSAKILRRLPNAESKSFFVIIIILLISLLSVRTIVRTFDWRDPVSFYNISLQQSPGNIPMINNLAMTYAEQGQTDLAINEYKMIIGKNDVYPNVHHNLGNVYKALGKYKEAEVEYKKALEMNPKFYFSLYALADLYQKTNQVQKLEEIDRKIKHLQPIQNL